MFQLLVASPVSIRTVCGALGNYFVFLQTFARLNVIDTSVPSESVKVKRELGGQT